jgi:hypothetical protein
MNRKRQEKIIGVLEGLSPADQAAVLSFAEFLLSRAATVKGVPALAVAVEMPEPELGPRPQDEKVVAAIKRLSKAYYMLDKSKMLGVTSDLVTQHILQGREAMEVIDRLEQIFADHYRQLKQGDGE